MKILISNNKTFDKTLDKILEKRKNKILSSSVSVSNIIKDVKKNGDKSLLKYEKRFNKNSKIIPSSKEISKLIKDENQIDIKPSMIQPVSEIKSLGKFKVKITLHSEVDAEITINVQSADTIQ